MEKASGGVAAFECPVAQIDSDTDQILAKYDPPVPPVPRAWPLVGVLPDLARDPYGFFQKYARKHGDVVGLQIPGVSMVVISHPTLVHDVLIRNWSRYSHSDPVFDDALLPGDPPGVATMEGDEWKRTRRLLNPGFGEAALKGVSPLIVEAIADNVAGWSQWADTGKPFDIQHELAVLVMSGLARSMFNAPFDRKWMEQMINGCYVHGTWVPKALGTYLFTKKLPSALGAILRRPTFPWPHLASGKQNYREVCAMLDGVIEAREKSPIAGEDLLGLLMSARFDEGRGFTHDEIRSHLMTILFAGHETTAAGVAWALAFLALNPAELGRAEAEVRALGDRPLGYDLLADTPFLRACFDEALRLQGTPALPAYAEKDDVIGGFRIQPGTWVVLPMHAVHTDPRFWDEPEKFKPSRFIDGKVNREAFFPFGAGPRKCLGMRMSYIEGVLALIEIIRRYRPSLPAGFVPDREFHMATSIKELPMCIASRS